MTEKWSTARAIALSLPVLLGLALPFLPVPGDGAIQMHVRFHTVDMAAPHAFSATTTRSICAVMAAALAFENRGAGTYIRITCTGRRPLRTAPAAR